MIIIDWSKPKSDEAVNQDIFDIYKALCGEEKAKEMAQFFNHLKGEL